MADSHRPSYPLLLLNLFRTTYIADQLSSIIFFVRVLSTMLFKEFQLSSCETAVQYRFLVSPFRTYKLKGKGKKAKSRLTQHNLFKRISPAMCSELFYLR